MPFQQQTCLVKNSKQRKSRNYKEFLPAIDIYDVKQPGVHCQEIHENPAVFQDLGQAAGSQAPMAG